MLLSEGDSVKYKEIEGVVTFMSDHFISILVRQGKHRSQDVKVIVYKQDFNKVIVLGEK